MISKFHWRLHFKAISHYISSKISLLKFSINPLQTHYPSDLMNQSAKVWLLKYGKKIVWSCREKWASRIKPHSSPVHCDSWVWSPGQAAGSCARSNSHLDWSEAPRGTCKTPTLFRTTFINKSTNLKYQKLYENKRSTEVLSPKKRQLMKTICVLRCPS